MVKSIEIYKSKMFIPLSQKAPFHFILESLQGLKWHTSVR